MRGIFKAARVGIIVAIVLRAAVVLVFWFNRSVCASQDGGSDAEREARWSEFYDALKVYRRVILDNDTASLSRVPKKIAHPMGFPSIVLRPRPNAADFFKRTRGRALVGGRFGALAALEPDELPGSVLNNPAELTVWHNTGHHGGVRLAIEDDNGRILADSGMRQFSHYQELLCREKIKVYYAEPTAPGGSIKIYAWSLESSSAMPSAFLEMPVKFADYKKDKWDAFDTPSLKRFFEAFRLYILSLSAEYYRGIYDDLPENMPEPLTGRAVYFKKSAREISEARLIDWRYGPLVAAVEPYDPQGLLPNPARLDVWHNSGDDARFAITISDDKKNTLADFVMPHLEGFPAALRREKIEINFKKPSTRKGSVRLSAVFPCAGSAGCRETLMEYPVQFAE